MVDVVSERTPLAEFPWRLPSSPALPVSEPGGREPECARCARARPLAPCGQGPCLGQGTCCLEGSPVGCVWAAEHAPKVFPLERGKGSEDLWFFF